MAKRRRSGMTLGVIMAGLLALLALLAACGQLPGDGGGNRVASKQIGPAGGSLSSTDGRLTLSIPAGALGNTETITIEEISPEALGPEFDALEAEIGKAYELGPDGLAFASPVTATFASDQEALQDDGSLEVRTVLLLTIEGGEVRALENPAMEVGDEGEVRVGGELSHFSPLVESGFFIDVRIAGVPEELEPGEVFEVSAALVDREDQADVATYYDLSEPPVDALSLDFAEPSPLEEIAANQYFGTFDYTCTEPGTGRYSARVGIEMELSPSLTSIISTQLSQTVRCTGPSGPPNQVIVTVLDEFVRPLPGADVIIGDTATQTGADGKATVPNVSPPFDATVIDPDGERVIVFNGLMGTDMSVMLPGTASPEPWDHSATVSGQLLGTSGGADSVVASAAVFPEVMTGAYADVTPGETGTTYTLTQDWDGPPTIYGSLYSIEFLRDAAFGLSDISGFGVRELQLSGSDDRLGFDLTLEPVEDRAFEVDATPPPGFRLVYGEHVLRAGASPDIRAPITLTFETGTGLDPLRPYRVFDHPEAGFGNIFVAQNDVGEQLIASRVYESPTFGYVIEWDPEAWENVPSIQNLEPGAPIGPGSSLQTSGPPGGTNVLYIFPAEEDAQGYFIIVSEGNTFTIPDLSTYGFDPPPGSPVDAFAGNFRTPINDFVSFPPPGFSLLTGASYEFDLDFVRSALNPFVWGE